MSKLTPKQIGQLRDEAKQVIFEDARQDDGYLWRLVDRYVDQTPAENLAELISSDPDCLRFYVDFDPETGKPWEDNDSV